LSSGECDLDRLKSSALEKLSSATRGCLLMAPLGHADGL